MPAERDFAAKNGSVWPWLLPFYIKACFDIDGDAFLPQAEEALENFDEDIQRYGIGSICELYDADPPYASRGSHFAGVGVGAALDIHRMIASGAKGIPKRPKPRRRRQNERSEREKSRRSEARGEKRREKTVKAAAKVRPRRGPQGRGEKAAPKAAAGKSRKEIKATK